MNETMVYADSFFEEFVGERDFLNFLEDRKEKTTWKKELSNTLRFEALVRDTPKTEAIVNSYDSMGKGDILKDTLDGTQLVLRDGDEYIPVRSCAIKTILERAKISGNALSKVERNVFAKILNHCMKVADGQALLKVSDDKVSAIHGGSTAQKLMKSKGLVTDHKMFAKGCPGCGWGANEGRIAAFPMTLSNCKTEDGKLTFYVDEGEFTAGFMTTCGLTAVGSPCIDDGSTLPDEINFANTSIAVEMAAQTGASVEAEIGSMGARESGTEGGESIYTTPEAAKKFSVETGIDALACAFGTAHGIYLKEPKLDFERLDEINKVTNVPIVMHGGSGVSHEDYEKVIALGVRKINYYTYMAKAGGEAVSDKTYGQFHDASNDAIAAMKADVKKAMRVFCN